MALDEDLRSEIINSSTTLGPRVHQNLVPQPQAKVFPRCWFQRSRTDDHLAADGSRLGFCIHEFDIECISSDIDQAIAAAEAIRRGALDGGLHGKRGAFGSGTVQGTMIEDHDDNYIPRGTGEDAGLHVSTLRMTIYTT